MIDLMKYCGREIIILCHSKDQVDEVCAQINDCYPSAGTINSFYVRAKRDVYGGVGIRIRVSASGETVEFSGFAEGSFYKNDPDYRLKTMEFDDLCGECEPFQPPETSFWGGGIC